MSVEGLTLNGLDLQAGPYILKELHMPPPAKRQEWSQSGDADGATLIRDPLFENRQISGTLEVKDTTRDLIQADIGAVSDMIEEAERNDGGIPLTWTAADGTKSLTFYVLSGSLGEIPQTVESGYFAGLVEVPFTLDCKPFGYGSEVTYFLDDFAADTSSLYTSDAGSALVISGGQMSFSSTAEQRRYLASHYAVDKTAGWKFTTGSTVPSSAIGLRLRRLDATNYLYGYVDPSGGLNIYKVDGGVFTQLAMTARAALSTATNYWLTFQTAGNVLTTKLYTADPATGAAAVTTATYTLAGADATKFGTGIGGAAGFRISGVPTDYRYDNLKIDPAQFRGTDPALVFTLPAVGGDVPAESRLIVTDPATQDRRFVEFGVQSRWTQLANSLLLDDGALVTTLFAGTSGALAGAYGGTAITATLTTNPVAVCGLPNGTNIGSFRVKARVRPSTSTIWARLNWREGDGPLRANTYQLMQQSGTFIEIDLGMVTIPAKQLGTQRWTGQIEAYDTAGAGSTLAIDHVVLIPADESYGKARAPVIFETVTAFSARDEFDQAAGNLSGKTLPVGGTWSAGTASDFVVEASGHTAQRATINDAADAFGIAGAATLTNVLVQVDLKATAGFAVQGLFARYTDTSNFLYVRWTPTASGSSAQLLVTKRAAGVSTGLRFVYLPLQYNSYYTMRLVVTSAGGVVVWLFPTGTPAGSPSLVATDSALATGGALASGKVGLYDYNNSPTASTRNYDNFFAGVPSSQAVLFSGRQLELRYDGAIRQDSTGTYWGNVPAYRGSRFFLPPAGQANRLARVLVKADRNDVEQFEDVPIGDNLQAAAIHTPRYLQVPR